MLSKIILVVALSWVISQAYYVPQFKAIKLKSIEEYGAIHSDQNPSTAQNNSLAILAALMDLNCSDTAVWIPGGKNFYIQNMSISGLVNTTIQIDGNLTAHDTIKSWPINGGTYSHIFEFLNCENITFTGNGDSVIEGKGYLWWVGAILNFNKLYKYGRPLMIHTENGKNFYFENINMRNSPYYHMALWTMDTCTIRNISIWVDIDYQKSINFNSNSLGLAKYLPTFPLNTDGIDPSGRNFYIVNITIQNFDDAVAVKPTKLYEFGCTENIYVENATVYVSVGMSIGSVPPNEKVNCIRNVTFKNIKFILPFKGVYIKTNHGDIGWGIIDNINYENIEIIEPMFFPIYIGPQQQKQPDGGGDGIWPPPNPRVNVSNISIKNLTSSKGWLNAGVLRCNTTNPCHHIKMEDVYITGWDSDNYVCEAIYGTCKNCTPVPSCMKPDEEYELEYQQIK